MQDVSFLHQVVKRRTRLLNYMLFLRVTPTLPNTFINVASPIVDVPYHIFFIATFIGLIPAAYVTVRVRFFLAACFTFLFHFRYVCMYWKKILVVATRLRNKLFVCRELNQLQEF